MCEQSPELIFSHLHDIEELITTCYCITCCSNANCQHFRRTGKKSTCGLLTHSMHRILENPSRATIIRYHNICMDDPLIIADFLCNCKVFVPAAAGILESTASYTPATPKQSGCISIYLAPMTSLGKFMDLEAFFQEMTDLGLHTLLDKPNY